MRVTIRYNRCSIGSASSLQEDGREDNDNNLKVEDDSGSDHMHRLGLKDLGVRRVSEISHINEIRREVRKTIWILYKYINDFEIILCAICVRSHI